MQKNVKKEPSTWPMIQRLFSISGKQRRWFYLALIIDLTQAGILIAFNHFNRQFLDAVSTQDTARFWLFVWASLSLSLIGIPLSYLKTRGVGQFSESTLVRLRGSLAARSAVLPVDYLEVRHSGDLLSVLNADLTKVKTLLANNLLDLIGQSVRAIAAFVYIVSINWVLALVSTILTPVLFMLISVLSRPVEKRSGEMQEEIGQVNSVAQDGLSGAMVVKSFNLSAIIIERFHQANTQALKKGLGIARQRAIIDAVGFGLSITPFIIAFGLGGYLVIHQQITFGGLFAFINLLNYVVNPLGSLPGVIASISEATGGARRAFDLLDQAPERKDGTVTRPVETGDLVPNAIQFRDVSFGYADGSPVLKHVSLDIPKGQTVAIVGPSGGGKSTLVKLILGYYALPDGCIQLFGEDLNHWRLADARQQMAFVSQDTYLFPVSIGENIRLGKPGASQADIEQAARQANIHDFIAALPEGYNTSAGEWGARLSGGQKQRISLARAILKEAPILLLDEPTSALDTESEALVQQALDRFTADRTTVVIAHRLSTIKNADRVVVLDDGAVVESGTHEALMAQGGVYLELYQRQFQLDQPATTASTGAFTAAEGRA